MTEGFQTILAASDEERRDFLLALPTGFAPMSRTSKKTSGFAGRSMRSSMNWKPLGLYNERFEARML